MSESELMSHSHHHVARCGGHLVQLVRLADAFVQVTRDHLRQMADLHVVIFLCTSRADVHQGIS